MDMTGYNRLEEAPEEPPQEPPPAYTPNRIIIGIDLSVGLAELSTLSRVYIRLKSVATEPGNVLFDLKSKLEYTGCCSADIFLELYDITGRLGIRLKLINGCCRSGMEVYIRGQKVSEMLLNGFFRCFPKYTVSDASGEKVLRICTGGLWVNRLMIKLKDMQDNQIGSITNVWNGWANEFTGMFSDRNKLQIDFPKDLGVQYKAAIIGFCYFFILFAKAPSTI